MAVGTRRRWRRWVIAGAVVVPVALFAAVYLLFFTSDSPGKLELSNQTGTTAAAATGSPAGTWTPAAGSVAGYRVREKLAFLSAQSDAVGRTGAVTGSVTITGDGDQVRVTDVRMDVDVTQLQSDEGRRDRRIRTMGLESARFPTATFRLTGPIAVPAGAVTGQQVDVQATGDLTIHGVTKREAIPLKVQRTGQQIEVVGSLRFAWSEFDMEAPNVGGIVSVQSDPTLEFKLLLARTA